MIEPTEEMERAYDDAAWENPVELGGLEMANIRAGLAAVLAIVERDRRSGTPLPGEPVWEGISQKRLTLEMEDGIHVEGVDLGLADRPSEVVRLLRQAATDMEQAWREATS